MTEKYCKDCVFFVQSRNKGNEIGDFCASTKHRELVNGEPDYAINVRRSPDLCGSEGKWFGPRLNGFPGRP